MVMQIQHLLTQAAGLSQETVYPGRWPEQAVAMLAPIQYQLERFRLAATTQHHSPGQP